MKLCSCATGQWWGGTHCCTSNFIAARCHGVPAGRNSFGYGRISNSRHISPLTVNRDPALKRIVSIGAAVFGMACAGLIGFAVTSAEQTSAYGILFVTPCLLGLCFFSYRSCHLPINCQDRCCQRSKDRLEGWCPRHPANCVF